ncbi:MAG: chromosome segregation protein SMC [Anaerolineae bacterium]|nr:chromosome segregation protein SMC [Anaerolineae bacterium]
MPRKGSAPPDCLKALHLLGYKSFAASTTFTFGPGITAVVGPNGSGKSNIADAIRWVLGEQSFRVLRGRRTEDMIFAGSETRSRLGMAEASITFSNENGWLPIDFAEVTITRRAYRSGENEYLLNGSRVRLREVQELLAHSDLGERTYTVIGQGLVDRALSLRPEERRALIENAAGLSGYQDRRQKALQRLEATQANLVRTRDILQELAPRLRRLEGQAARAEEHARLTEELQSLLRVAYGYRWRQAQQALRLARQRLARARTAWEEALGAVERLEQEEAQMRLRLQALRQALGGWHSQSSQLHTELEQTQREAAVLEERRHQVARQREDAERQVRLLERERAARLQRLEELERERETIAARLKEHRSRVQEARAALQERQARQAQARAEAERVAREATAARRRQEEAQRVLASLRSQMAHWADELRAHQEAVENLARQEALFQEKRAELQSRLGELRRAREETQREKERLEAGLADVRQRIAAAHNRLSALEAQRERLRARLDDLTRQREEMAGLYPGVRAVLRAKDRLRGLIGTVASQVTVPPELEPALEAALGSHLQDIIARTWADAEAAVRYLRETRAGRATFLPLDTLRPPPPLRPPALPGVLGVASDLVAAPEELGPAVQLLLNRTLVVQDLKAARAAFDRLQGGFQIVTLQGEIVRSSGALTGGSDRRAGRGLLAREGEWRRLPEEIRGLERTIATARKQVRALEEEQEGLLARLAEAEAALRQHQQALEALQEQANAQEAQAQALAREREWHTAQGRKVEELLANARTQEEASLAALEDAQQALARLEAEGERLRNALEAEDVATLERELSFLEAQGRVLEGDQAAAERIWQATRQEVASLESQQRERQEQVQALAQQAAQLEKQLEALREREAALGSRLQTLQERIQPTEAEVQELDDRLMAFSSREREARRALREQEERMGRASLEVERLEDRLRRLREQIEQDLGLVQVEPANGVPEQPPLPLQPLVSSLPVVEEPPEGLEETVRKLQAQIARLGAVNPEAPAEYRALRERYQFLETQSQDLEKAAQDLREVIAELDHLMEVEFKRTFDLVNEHFKQFFQRLFGGGAARLVLTDPDDLTHTGIEIVARPPGKRQQTLAALSGGERALTAVALLFAILETSPTPFCVLDEVDAMLDEANIGRFRQALVELSHKTQFIVISHNRKTIEAAHRIYGVSMRRDGSSQVVSLRLEDEMEPTEAAA